MARARWRRYFTLSVAFRLLARISVLALAGFSTWMRWAPILYLQSLRQ